MSQGFELETRIKLIEGSAGTGLTFTGSLGYIDAQYKRFIDSLGRDVAADRDFQNTPKWTASGTLTFTTPMTLIGAGSLDLAPGLSYRSRTTQFESRSPLDQAGYALVDVALVWRSDDDKWSLGLYGKNLTDKQYKVAGYNFMSTNPATGALNLNAAGSPTATLGREGVLTAFYGNPRQFYATVGVKF